MSNELKITNAAGEVTIEGDGNRGNLRLGGNGAGGDLIMQDASGSQQVHIDGGDGNITLGGRGSNGEVLLRSDSNEPRMHLHGGSGNVSAGGNGCGGDITLKNEKGSTTVHIDGGSGNLNLGGEGANADIRMRDAAGTLRLHLDGETGRIFAAKVAGADYVFEPGYDLKPLAEVEKHIVQKGHLPGVQSAAQMQAEGVDLVAFSVKLLEKVEELTLHSIALEKRLSKLEGE